MKLTDLISSLLIANADVSPLLRMLITHCFTSADFVRLLADGDAFKSVPHVFFVPLASSDESLYLRILILPFSRGEVDSVVIRATLMYLYS